MNRQPHLKGQLIELRPLQKEDFPDLLRAAADPAIWELHPLRDRYKPEVFQLFLDSAIESQGALTIIDLKSKKIIGSSRYYFHEKNREEIVIGYTFLTREFWGGAYNFELKKLMIDHAFLSFDTICWHVGSTNLRSRKAVEKIGALYDHQFVSKTPDGREVINFCYKMKKNFPYKALIASNSQIESKQGQLVDADYGRHFQSHKIGVHWSVLQPGERSSYPHAESHEEEFVYVQKGTPHVWLDGYIYQLQQGHFVGFPAGTGLAHSFINNSKESVELICVGERTKAENKYYYPSNPELFNDHKNNWWHRPSNDQLGPHNGLPGNLEYQRDWKEAMCIQHIENCERKSFSYPNDNETFSNGTRLSSPVGLKALGIWHEVMPVRKRSSWPHAHKKEEEFCVVLKGQGQVWLNGYTYSVRAGDAVYFPSGTNIAHTLMNDGKEDLCYLGIGQSALHCEGDQITYPNHPKRNEDCKAEKYFWEKAPQPIFFGPHRGEPTKK